MLPWLMQVASKAGGALLLWHGGVSRAPPSLPVAPVATGRDVSRLFLLYFNGESFTLDGWRAFFGLFLLVVICMMLRGVHVVAGGVGDRGCAAAAA